MQTKVSPSRRQLASNKLRTSKCSRKFNPGLLRPVVVFYDHWDHKCNALFDSPSGRMYLADTNDDGTLIRVPIGQIALKCAEHIHFNEVTLVQAIEWYLEVEPWSTGAGVFELHRLLKMTVKKLATIKAENRRAA